MIVKSVIAGTVLSLMAGGVVYFGTDVDAGDLTDKVTTKVADVKADISDKVMAGGKNHPHETQIENPEAKTSVHTPSVKTPSGKLIEAKNPTVSYSSGSETKTAEATQDSKVNPTESKPQKKWLNKYLKKDTVDAEVLEKGVSDVDEAKTNVNTETVTKTVVTEEVVTEDIKGPEDTSSVAQDLMASMGLTPESQVDAGSDSATGTFVVEEELTEDVFEAATDETNGKKTTRKMLRDIIKKDRAVVIAEGPDGQAKNIEVKVINGDNGTSTVETETIDMGDGKVMKIIRKTIKSDSAPDGTHDIRIKVFTDKDGKGGLSADDIKVIRSGKNVSIHELLNEAKSKDISATVKVVMEQAEKIEMPELRDRAYLDLVSYGLDHGDYSVATKALKKIEQVELRDTARNRIAVTYAKEGNAEEAFGILDDLEVDALRDVMRLQVIEAMIAPEELPQDMQ